MNACWKPLFSVVCLVVLSTAVPASAAGLLAGPSHEVKVLYEKPGVVNLVGGYYPNSVPAFSLIVWRRGYRDMVPLADRVAAVLVNKYTSDWLPPTAVLNPIQPISKLVAHRLVRDKLLAEWRRLSTGKYRTTTWITIQNRPNRQWFVTCGYN